MPGPVGGDFFSESEFTNYTHMYLKSVENALFKKSINKITSSVNQTDTKTANSSSSNVEIEKDKVASETSASAVPPGPSSTSTPAPPPQQSNPNVTKEQLEVLDDLLTKELNAEDAHDLLKNMSSANMGDVLEEAKKHFPGTYVKSML